MMHRRRSSGEDLGAGILRNIEPRRDDRPPTVAGAAGAAAGRAGPGGAPTSERGQEISIFLAAMYRAVTLPLLIHVAGHEVRNLIQEVKECWRCRLPPSRAGSPGLTRGTCTRSGSTVGKSGLSPRSRRWRDRNGRAAPSPAATTAGTIATSEPTVQ